MLRKKWRPHLGLFYQTMDDSDNNVRGVGFCLVFIYSLFAAVRKMHNCISHRVINVNRVIDSHSRVVYRYGLADLHRWRREGGITKPRGTLTSFTCVSRVFQWKTGALSMRIPHLSILTVMRLLVFPVPAFLPFRLSRFTNRIVRRSDSMLCRHQRGIAASVGTPEVPIKY